MITKISPRYRYFRYLTLFLVATVLVLLTTLANYSYLSNVQNTFNAENYSQYETEDIINIVLVTSEQLKRSRQQSLEMIADRMNMKSCCKGCRVSVTYNQQEINKADAVMYVAFQGDVKGTQLPKRGDPDQMWIFHQMESPAYHSPGVDLNDLFNWTLTFRRDSDIYQPYYRIYELPETEALPKGAEVLINSNNSLIPISEWSRKKDKLALAVVSNCQTKSKREDVLKKLQKSGLQLELLGHCYKKTNCKYYGMNCTNFWADLAQHYKFYMAFENSLCWDYITEKFWRALELGMVPVVLGGATYADFAPPHSFIDLRDFNSPEDLKNYLNWLDKNPEEYGKYFDWRREFGVERGMGNFCGVCEKLKDFKLKSKLTSDLTNLVKTNNLHLRTWWTSQPSASGSSESKKQTSACHSPEDIGLGKFIK